MKTKLLRKIRKRFGYYRSKESGKYILVDHEKKISHPIDEKFCRKYDYLKKEDEFPDCIKVSKEEYFWRILRTELIFPFTHTPIIDRIFYSKGKGALANGATLYKDKEENKWIQ